MESHALSWLDKNFLRNLLQQTEGDESLEVSSITVKPATSKGDNYLSEMHRVEIEFSRIRGRLEMFETRPVIVKLALRDETRSDKVLHAKLFETEVSMTLDTLPRMNQILARANIPSLSARCLHAQNETPIHLIFEDLVPAGYRMANCQGGLDFDHCLLVVQTLAAFHASSVALARKDFQAVKKYNNGLYSSSCSPWMATFFNSAVNTLGKEVANWMDLNPRISEKLMKLSRNFFEKAMVSATIREDDFNVLNHGDCWINNSMFRYDQHQKPMGHIFVDFQLSCYGSAAADILNFLGSSLCNDVRVHKRESLIQEYHKSLTSIMVKLNCSTEIPSFEKLEGMLRDRAFHEMAASCITLPLVLLDKEKLIHDRMRPGQAYNDSGYRNELYREVMTRILSMHDKNGVLD